MNIWKSLKGLPRDVWVLAAATLINRAGTMVLPFLVLYLTRELGFSPYRAGLALAVYGAGSIIAAPISGRLTDRIGPLPVMRVSLLAGGLLMLMVPLVRSFPAVLAVTLVWAVMSELFRPANLVIIADIVPGDKLKPAYALSRLAINLGMSVGPAAAGFIAEKSFTWIFIVDAVTTLAAAAILIANPFAASHRHAHQAENEKTPSIFSTLVLDDRRMVLFLAAVFLMGVVFFQIEGPLPLFLVQDLSLSPAFRRLVHAEHGYDRVHGGPAQCCHRTLAASASADNRGVSLCRWFWCVRLRNRADSHRHRDDRLDLWRNDAVSAGCGLCGRDRASSA